MPPKTRTKVARDLKENNVKNNKKTIQKIIGKPTKIVRKPLTDKTNSASDENESIDLKKSVSKKLVPTPTVRRPRRDKRLPSRFIGDLVLENISINAKSTSKFDNVQKTGENKNSSKTVKRKSSINSHFKSPQIKEKSIVENRPKRIQRLPARFEDHSVSPSKFIPLQPCFASTPIANKNYQGKTLTPLQKKEKEKKDPSTKPDGVLRKKVANTSSDTNNNADKETLLRTTRKQNVAQKLEISPAKKSPQKTVSRKENNKDGRLLNTNFSFRVFDEVQSPKKMKAKLDIYDFTFDPSEEPQPQKKKRKRTVKKKAPPKPKKVVVKNNYDANISKTMQILKNIVAKPANLNDKETEKNNETTQKQPEPIIITNVAPAPTQGNTTNEKVVDDVANITADFNDHINYSPISTPNHNTPRPLVKSAVNETRDQLYAGARSTMIGENQTKDPLNLLEELSFTDVPVANSSMNTSVRHPMASPWRVEFTNLPIKWQDNTYVKPNMTPAVESSFISSLEQKKKHVYTNIVGESNNVLPEIVPPDNDSSKWKQTSIISFIKEAAERSAKKNHKKASSKKLSAAEKNVNVTPSSETSYCDLNLSNEKENSREVQTPVKRKADLESEVPAKSPCIENKSPDKFFGFDDSEDQENVSPTKINNHRGRSLRPRRRAVLQEVNKITGPSRAQLPCKNKLAPNSEIVNKLFNEMKSATEAPEIPVTETVAERELEVSTANDSWHESMEERNEEAHSVHLFEDIDVVHHLKPQRKSYGNLKKTFCQRSTNMESQLDVQDDSDEEDPDDLPFQMPTIKTKKVAPRKKKGIKLTKKEEEEIEAWAAAFNSMCEDVDEFPLVVE